MRDLEEGSWRIYVVKFKNGKSFLYLFFRFLRDLEEGSWSEEYTFFPDSQNSHFFALYLFDATSASEMKLLEIFATRINLTTLKSVTQQTLGNRVSTHPLRAPTNRAVRGVEMENIFFYIQILCQCFHWSYPRRLRTFGSKAKRIMFSTTVMTLWIV